MGSVRTLYPVFMDLQGRKCAVVGGGTVAERKVRGLLSASARVVVVSPDLSPGLSELAAEGRIESVRREYREGDLAGVVLAFAATNRHDVNEAVAEEAGTLGVPVNLATGTGDGDFVVPSLLRRGELHVAVSTGGGSPAYARLIRERLDDLLGPEHADVVALLDRLRPRVKAAFPDDEARRRAVWDKLVSWETVDLVRRNAWDAIEEKVAECLSSS
ncbi:MAG: bifunctional precorrin-2 dehydrogenase/sirohydrochlorin ferrochelatase [Candidatus Latescibacteria bacterium]|jgi:siroheme synthase-like protein|nr:bifunctional precorrin-2 dehydrogenase/sirohydrochlorin ferrochelatase [Candidatus Latescibacterota bacterium]